MRATRKRIGIVIGCLLTVLLFFLIARGRHADRKETKDLAQLKPSHGPLVNQAQGPAGWHSAPAVPAADSESRHEDSLGLRKAIESSSPLNLAQIEAVLNLKGRDLTVTGRIENLRMIGRLMAEENPDLGLELIEFIEDFRDRHVFVKTIVESLVERDPARAAGWAARLTDSPLLHSAHRQIATMWGQVDVEACRTWAEAVNDPQARLSALEGLTWAWTLKDSSAAYDWAAQISDAGARDVVFVKMAKMTAIQDARQAAEWALSFPEGAGRSEALQYAVFQWAGHDLKAAADWAAQVADPVLRETSFVALAQSWSNQNPESATTWAAQLPEGPARTSALLTTARKWAEVNPSGAAQWIGQLAHTSARDDLFKNITAALAVARPSLAETWVSSTNDQNLRAAGEQIMASTSPGASGR